MKLERLLKKLDEATFTEVEALDNEGLHNLVVACENNITQATKERDDHADFKKAKEVVKDFNGALRDAKNFQNAKIAFALLRIKMLNGEDIGEEGNILAEVRNTVSERE